MKTVARFVLVGILVVASGCVMKSDYTAKLTEIDNLKTDMGKIQADNAALRKDVSARNEQLSAAEKEKAALQADLARLTKESEDLRAQNKALAADNLEVNNLLKAKKGELNTKITELRDQIAEKEKELAAKNAEIQALNQEKEKAVQEKEKSIAELKKTYVSLMGEMSEEIKKGEVTITQLKDKLSVNMVEQILFDSGSAEIKKDGKKVLERVADILKKVTDKQIRVEGFTDNVPISSRLAAKFPSNWELSTARATTVARYLQDKGIDPKILSAAGYAEFRPVAPNDNEEGRAKNRRIEIALVPLEI